jgi:outer membrane lipoprotein carrier protein
MYILCLLFSLSTFAATKSFLPASFSAQYENTWQSATGSTKKEFGSIDYKFPGNVKLDVKSDPQATFVTNKNTSWYYQPAFSKEEQAQVTIQKGSAHPVIKFLDSLKDGVGNTKYFTSKENGNDLVLTFTPDGKKDFSLQEVTLHGTKAFKDVASIKEIDSIDLKDSNGKTKKLKFIELKEGASFSPSHFTFTVPANTKVIKN